MSVTLAPPMFLQFLNPNNSGSPAVAYQLFTYEAGTNTKQATWTDSTQTAENANPLELDGNGVGNFWGDPTLAYKFVWAPANDTDPPSSPIRTVDNLYFPLSLAELTQQVVGAIINPITPAETAAGVTPVNYAYASSHIGDDVRRYGNIDLTGATDCRAILNTANSVGVALYFPPGIYKISSNITLNVPLYFDYGAILKPDASATITINAPVWAGPWQIFNLANQPAVTSSTMNLNITGLIRPVNAHGRMYVEWTGTVGDGTTDDTVAFQSACFIAQTAGCIGIQLQAKTYKITSTVYQNGTNASGNVFQGCPQAPSIYGIEKRQTTISCSGVGTSGAIQAIGGSGTLSMNCVEDIGFTGSGSDYGYVFNGKSGRARRCLFNTLAVGVQFFNGYPGAFTEYAVAEDCEWSSTCGTPIVYHMNGTISDGYSNSFNGSGITGGLINTSPTAAVAVCFIDSQCLPYNAPFSAQIWALFTGTVLFNNNAGAGIPVNFYGNLTTEQSTNVLILANNNPVVYCGTVNSNGPGVIAGTFDLHRAQMTINGGGQAPIGGYRASNTGFSVNPTTEGNTPGFKSGGRLVSVSIEGTNYDYRALLWVMNAGSGGAGSATVLGQTALINTPAYANPTYAVNTGGAIVVTNAAYPLTGIVMFFESTQINQGYPPSASTQFQI